MVAVDSHRQCVTYTVQKYHTNLLHALYISSIVPQCKRGDSLLGSTMQSHALSPPAEVPLFICEMVTNGYQQHEAP